MFGAAIGNRVLFCFDGQAPSGCYQCDINRVYQYDDSSIDIHMHLDDMFKWVPENGALQVPKLIYQDLVKVVSGEMEMKDIPPETMATMFIPRDFQYLNNHVIHRAGRLSDITESLKYKANVYPHMLLFLKMEERLIQLCVSKENISQKVHEITGKRIDWRGVSDQETSDKDDEEGCGVIAQTVCDELRKFTRGEPSILQMCGVSLLTSVNDGDGFDDGRDPISINFYRNNTTRLLGGSAVWSIDAYSKFVPISRWEETPDGECMIYYENDEEKHRYYVAGDQLSLIAHTHNGLPSVLVPLQHLEGIDLSGVSGFPSDGNILGLYYVFWINPADTLLEDYRVIFDEILDKVRADPSAHGIIIPAPE